MVEAGAGWTRTIMVPPGDQGAAKGALDVIEEAIRNACATGGCRTVSIAVHVQGAACDHEVKGG